MSENEERALFLLARGQVKRDREMIRQLVKIRKSRESEGLTQKEVAARMGSDQGFVSRFESLETNPNLRTIRAYALAVSLSSFLCKWGSVCYIVGNLSG
ncbi:helix-turn-helix transcriptional regulator [Mobiluncus mulieris]|uniref:helix-turn-helix domain-containing protein n=1 Tax=Mobiluncus mulieris TaxID=2052 RepID=UPI0021E21804|nr:helix-turn-helix transcriptional regulator [Mobiluncus mulieris]MCU9995157.1 helix-turn-helix transcriptional regulator [Mobiluncus mulieris]